MYNEQKGLCYCGCGKMAPISNRNNKKYGIKKGDRVRYIYGHHHQYGEFNAKWKGGKSKNGIYLRINKTKTGEHRQIVENVLGKKLPIGSVIHHWDGDGSNNSLSNLVICENESYHQLLHQRQNAKINSGDARKRKCCYCHQYDHVENLYLSKKGDARHIVCAKKYQRELYKRNKAAMRQREEL